jgi:dimeric dUTPase (all-alpha-NTP-PPase superfamily)
MIKRSRVAEVLVVSEDSINKISELLNKIKPLQDNLNKNLAKRDDYATALRVENGKFINYGNCLLSETDEIRNSTPWKHWKFAGEIDTDNLLVELADVNHFAPSLDLVCDGFDVNNEHIANLFTVDNNIEDLLDGVNYVMTDCDGIELADLINILNIGISLSATTLSMLFYKMKYNNNVTTPDSIVAIRTLGMEIMLLSTFIHQLTFNTSLEESINAIYGQYVIKNTLNGFRDNNGYNTGEYIKIWNDKEDNIIAMEIMKEHPDYTPKELYSALDEVYFKSVKLND